MTRGELPRFCREARAQLPFLATGELDGWGARVVRAHLRRCPGCAAERDRQDRLGAGLQALRDNPPEPPAELLDALLARTRRGGIRERAAGPARGAVSGARPALSVTFLTVGALASTGVGYAAWTLVRRVRGRGA
jgi:predicted anti-sigma-YlaC factor YlaD